MKYYEQMCKIEEEYQNKIDILKKEMKDKIKTIRKQREVEMHQIVIEKLEGKSIVLEGVSCPKYVVPNATHSALWGVEIKLLSQLNDGTVIQTSLNLYEIEDLHKLTKRIVATDEQKLEKYNEYLKGREII